MTREQNGRTQGLHRSRSRAFIAFSSVRSLPRAQAQERVKKVAAWLWSIAETWKPSDGAMCIVVHGMFIDILVKVLTGIPLTTGKQKAVFCSKNAGTHVLELKAGADGNIAGLQRFNILEYMPEEIQSGGSVEGLDDCYMNEGSA